VAPLLVSTHGGVARTSLVLARPSSITRAWHWPGRGRREAARRAARPAKQVSPSVFLTCREWSWLPNVMHSSRDLLFVGGVYVLWFVGVLPNIESPGVEPDFAQASPGFNERAAPMLLHAPGADPV